MGRFFAVVKGFEDEGVNLPQRSTSHSAGYDFEAVEDVVVPSIWQSYTALLRRQPQRDGEGWLIPEYHKMGYGDTRAGFKPTLVKTGVKANMEFDEKLDLYNRSSNPKKGLVLANGVGLVDSDYYGNPDNDGHVLFAFFNFSEDDYVIRKGERIGQGVFSKFLTVNNDNASGDRLGGYGSSGI